MILNIGCGANKLPGHINIDANGSLDPDLILDVSKQKLPYEDDSVSAVVCSHTIEHIPRSLHWHVFNELNRVLKMGGTIFFSFPEFPALSKHYLANTQGKKEMWETMIFGRRLDPWDCHVTAMVTADFINFLKECGFHQIKTAWEEGTDYYALVYASKSFSLIDKSEILRKEVGTYASR